MNQESPEKKVQTRAAGATLASTLPPLLAAAEKLAATAQMGEHGRRRTGLGDEFWQYRPAQSGDSRRHIDWRRSARGDVHFVQEKEWKAAQSVLFWVDTAQSMGFSGAKERGTKRDRAQVLGLALASLLIDGGERVALDGLDGPPRSGRAHMLRIAEAMLVQHSADYGAPQMTRLPSGAQAVFLSDFLGDWDTILRTLSRAADQGVKGILGQILDPIEEVFPFDGRTVFESMGNQIRHETLKAGGLRDRYLERLAARKDALRELAARTGWQYHCHHTDQSAQSTLLWFYSALRRGR